MRRSLRFSPTVVRQIGTHFFKGKCRARGVLLRRDRYSLQGQRVRLGFDVTEAGEGERILAAAIVEHFVTRADGQLEPLIEGSTKPVAETRTHAGIVRVRRFAFERFNVWVCR